MDKITVCGMNEDGVDRFLDTAEQMDKGTTRFPWPKDLKAEIKAAINGKTFMPDVQETVNKLVVAKAGPGLFGRGPFNLDGRAR
jgi:hypothetical protein